ncbi:uncharacterized protein LOC127862057 isoform X1 [Dreissena polymorpha]|uniref:uncharacterized protein LOC127862057 isoform X1 n=1 Tax=Dreissena polymorpha TaxID=45954 RepID=UPI0022650FCA|nr:uncharacterized protein LOC127862057 isoform X1 [Dreissena polymorpha]
MRMPRGVTPTRVRRRQSDAKWRASVAMCYNVMKHVIPHSKRYSKASKRKLSKALTLKETERHIVSLERNLRDLIENRAPLSGKVVMIERDNGSIVPATFEDIKQDFAMKQCLFFSSTSGKKRYNVPSDIETSLDVLSQQSCDLIAADEAEVAMSFPPLAHTSHMPLNNFKVLTRISKKQDIMNNTMLTSDGLDLMVAREQQTPSKSKMSSARGVLRCTSSQKSSTAVKSLIYAKTPSKACKQSFAKRGTLFTKATPVPKKGTPGRHCNGSTGGSGFTPVKLPAGLEGADRSLALPGTPSMSLLYSPFSSSMWQCPESSCFHGVDITSQDDCTSLLCTESIDSLEPPLSETPYNTAHVQSPSLFPRQHETIEKSMARDSIDKPPGRRMSRPAKCRRRLDRAYNAKQNDQEVPVDYKSSVDFDGYVQSYQHNKHSVDQGSPYMGLTLAGMWEDLMPEERALYAHMAIKQPARSGPTGLSEDLDGIDVKPLHDTAAVLSAVQRKEIGQQLPRLEADVTLNSCDMHLGLETDDLNYSLVPGIDDLDDFYRETYGGKKLVQDDVFFAGSYEDEFSQVVPEL